MPTDKAAPIYHPGTLRLRESLAGFSEVKSPCLRELGQGPETMVNIPM